MVVHLLTLFHTLLPGCLVLLLGFSTFINAGRKATPADVAGNWEGKLKVSGVELRVVFRISEEGGHLSAKMDSPDQGAKDIPVNSVSLTDNHILLTVEVIGGKYEGEIIKDSLLIRGTWTQSGMSLPLTLKKVEKVSEVKRPQEPQKPYPYREEEVTFASRASGVTLAGTLTLPQSGGPFPAVVLITGSGAQNRDEELFGHRPFLVLADYLTRRGIAVLRYDDRGTGQSTGRFSGATSEDFTEDALGAVQYLKSRPEINPKKIGLVGHSEGGLIASLAAVRSNDVAFIVMMAGPGLTGEEILLLQSRLISQAEGASERLIKQELKDEKAVFAIIKSEPDDSLAAKKIRAYQKQAWKTLDEDLKAEALKSGDPQKMLEISLKRMLNPWFRFFLTYGPRPTLEKVRCPVLAINGEKDLQVPPKENLSAIESALKAGGNTHYTVKELAGLNHLFQTAGSGAPSEYGKIEETFSPTAMDVIARWILGVGKE